MFKIKLRVFGFGPDDIGYTLICATCGEEYHRTSMIDYNLYENDNRIGALCDGCLERAFKLSSILRARASNLRILAKHLEKMADESITFPTKEEFESTVRDYKKGEPGYWKEWGPEFQKEWEEQQKRFRNENKS